jgi:hypothetical protein
MGVVTIPTWARIYPFTLGPVGPRRGAIFLLGTEFCMGRPSALYVRPLCRCFPFIAMAVGKLPVRSCLIDGEAIVCGENGLAAFDLIRALPDRIRGKSADVTIWRMSKQKGIGQPAQIYLGGRGRDGASLFLSCGI